MECFKLSFLRCCVLVNLQWSDGHVARDSLSVSDSEIYREFYFGIMYAIAGELNHGVYVFKHKLMIL